MTRMEFLKQLEYLLQDIDEKDREDALNYYMDYMDDAGLSETDPVDGLLDIPERIAISIRSSLNGDDGEQTEFSEQGFKNIRLEPEQKMPQVYKNERSEDTWKEAAASASEREVDEAPDTDGEKGNRLGRILVIGILAILAIPLVMGVGGTLLGILAAIFMTLVAVVLAAACGGAALTVSGVVLFVFSIVRMPVFIGEGILVMGISFLLIALGILGIMLTVLLCKRFIPWCVRGIVNLFHRVFRKGGETA